MNCRDTESLILAERDGALTQDQRAALSDHVAACASCREFQERLTRALATYQSDLTGVPVPDTDTAWRDLQNRLRRPAKKRHLAPVIWFGAPLAAAAALAFAFLPQTPDAVPQTPPSLETARADFVEAGDTNASTMVYVDKESGWLVVWAAGDAAGKNG